MESTKETGCQAPEGPIICVNNCGFSGSAATMNMCSKCHKDMMLKREHQKFAASSFDNIVNRKEPMVVQSAPVELLKEVPTQTCAADSSSSLIKEVKAKEGPSRCDSSCKRVGLTGFSCKCGNIFCSAHRYSDKHECPFDYRTAGRNAIAKANPVVKADKLDKI